MAEKFALVTGAGTGIGRAASLALIEVGWTLALIGRRLAPLEETAALAQPSRSFCTICDVSSPVQVAKTFAEVEARFGRLDLLFNNAGMAGRSVPMEELSFPEWKSVVDVNLTGAFLCTQQAMRITRNHAKEWGIDPKKVGVIGFSAGAHLAVVLSTHPEFQGKNVPVSAVDARPAFQMVIYPGYTSLPDGKVPASIVPSAEVPPTFLVQAENDYAAHVESSIFYFMALKDAKVAAFVDGNPVNVGKKLRGVPIIRPEQLENRRAPIILATLLHTQGIRERVTSLGLTNPMVTLHAK